MPFLRQLFTPRVIALFVIATLGAVVLVATLVSAPALGFSDFRAYWSASRLLLTNQNPYDPQALFALERGNADPNQDFPMMVWNPPVAFLFLLPVAVFPFQIARSLWVFINVALFLGSCLLLALVYLPKGRGAFIAYLGLAAVFAPPLVAILVGQITILVLFGLALSLYLFKQEQFFAAGAALILTGPKPHLVLLAAVYLLVVMALRRRWDGWAGLATSGLLGLVALFVLRLNWISDFLNMLNEPPIAWATPTLGGLLATWGIATWPRYIGFVCLAFIPLFALRRHSVSVETAVSILTLITIPTTFFGWGYDQSMLLVPMAQIVGWLSNLESRSVRRVFAGLIGLVLAAQMVHRYYTTSEVYYVWVPFAWAGLYLVVAWLAQHQPEPRLNDIARG